MQALEAVDETRLAQFLERAVQDMGAAVHAVLVVIGDRLGLFRAMAGAGPLTSAQVAERTGVDERYVREWLNANAAAGWIDYDAATGQYRMSPEQSFALLGMDLPGAYQIVASLFRDEGRISEAMRCGQGFAWHEHDSGLFEGTER
ncbi:MAG TPA: hypothetical protein VNJ11_13990, partial [Bryobacteraceae bacterium]|nr:hypothetical protein [Bryobacteraceae bacterium]